MSHLRSNWLHWKTFHKGNSEYSSAQVFLQMSPEAEAGLLPVALRPLSRRWVSACDFEIDPPFYADGGNFCEWT